MSVYSEDYASECEGARPDAPAAEMVSDDEYGAEEFAAASVAPASQRRSSARTAVTVAVDDGYGDDFEDADAALPAAQASAAHPAPAAKAVPTARPVASRAASMYSEEGFEDADGPVATPAAVATVHAVSPRTGSRVMSQPVRSAIAAPPPAAAAVAAADAAASPASSSRPLSGRSQPASMPLHLSHSQTVLADPPPARSPTSSPKQRVRSSDDAPVDYADSLLPILTETPVVSYAPIITGRVTEAVEYIDGGFGVAPAMHRLAAAPIAPPPPSTLHAPALAADASAAPVVSTAAPSSPRAASPRSRSPRGAAATQHQHQSPRGASHSPAKSPAHAVSSSRSPTTKKPSTSSSVAKAHAAKAATKAAISTPAAPAAAPVQQQQPSANVSDAGYDDDDFTSDASIPSSAAAMAAAMARPGTRAQPSSKKAAPTVAAAPRAAKPPRAPAPKIAVPSSPASIAPPAPAGAHRGVNYDRARREAMKQQRAQQAAESKARAEAAADAAEAEARIAAQIAEAARAAAPLQPPMDEHEAYYQQQHQLQQLQQYGSSKAPILPPPSSSPRKEYQIHPHDEQQHAAWAVEDQTQQEETYWQQQQHQQQSCQQYEEEKHQEHTYAQQHPLPSHPRPHRPPMQRPRPASSSSAGAPRSRAANAVARARIMANLALGRPPSAPTTAYSLYAESLQQQKDGGKMSRHEAWANATAQREARKSAQSGGSSLVHPVDSPAAAAALAAHAESLLHSLASSTPASQVPFRPLPSPVNATQHGDVPRCFPSSGITPRVGSARFARAKVFNGCATASSFQPDRVAAQDASDEEVARGAQLSSSSASQAVQNSSWDIGAELQYGHSLVGGLKARTQLLAAKLASNGVPHARPLSAAHLSAASVAPVTDLRGFTSQATTESKTRQSAHLFHALSLASSMENYYSLVGQLDEGVRKAKEHGAGLAKALDEPAPAPASPASEKKPPSLAHRYPSRPGSAFQGAVSSAALPPSVLHTQHSSTLDGLPVWQHSNTVLPSGVVRPPSSAHRAHPSAPPTLIPAYDSLLDPHASRVLGSQTRTRTIASTRAAEFHTRPELREVLLEKHVANQFAKESDAARQEKDRRRKLKLNRPEGERISQRPRSAFPAAAVGEKTWMPYSPPSSTKRQQQQPSRRPAGSAHAATFRGATSAYGSTQPPRSKEAWRRGHYQPKIIPRWGRMQFRPGSSTSQTQQAQMQQHAGEGADSTEQEEWMKGLVREDDDDEGEEDGDEFDEQTTGAAGDQERELAQAIEPLPSYPVDWWSISSSSWPKEPSQLTRDLITLGVIDGRGGEAQGGRVVGADDDDEALSDPAERLRVFHVAERCLHALHTQLGLPFDPSSSSADAPLFSVFSPPAPEHIRALLSVIRALIPCRDLVVHVLHAIAAREHLVSLLNEASSHANERRDLEGLLSRLAVADRSVEKLIDSYATKFEEIFPGRMEFAAPPPEQQLASADEEQSDVWQRRHQPALALQQHEDAQRPFPFWFRGEDYGERVRREREQLQSYGREQQSQQQPQAHQKRGHQHASSLRHSFASLPPSDHASDSDGDGDEIAVKATQHDEAEIVVEAQQQSPQQEHDDSNEADWLRSPPPAEPLISPASTVVAEPHAAAPRPPSAARLAAHAAARVLDTLANQAREVRLKMDRAGKNHT